MHRTGLVLAVSCTFSGCFAGNQPGVQGLAVATTPPGANCTVARGGATLGRIAVTPGSLAIPQGASPLAVTCAKPDHKDATVTLSPRYIGGAVDTLFGVPGPADYAYPAEIHLVLPPGPPDLAPNPPVPVTARPLPR